MSTSVSDSSRFRHPKKHCRVKCPGEQLSEGNMSREMSYAHKDADLRHVHFRGIQSTITSIRLHCQLETIMPVMD